MSHCISFTTRWRSRPITGGLVLQICYSNFSLLMHCPIQTWCTTCQDFPKSCIQMYYTDVYNVAQHFYTAVNVQAYLNTSLLAYLALNLSINLHLLAFLPNTLPNSDFPRPLLFPSEPICHVPRPLHISRPLHSHHFLFPVSHRLYPLLHLSLHVSQSLLPFLWRTIPVSVLIVLENSFPAGTKEKQLS